MEVGEVSGSKESFARKLWNKCQRQAMAALCTPFVLCLAIGDLKLETFHHCIGQDVHFLKAFARAYEVAQDCADDEDDIDAIHEMREEIDHELEAHASVFLEWGFDPAKEISASTATVKYTEFLLATTAGKIEDVNGVAKIVSPFEKNKIAAYTVGAMTPCTRLYAFLGKELQTLPDCNEGSHPYKKWIDNCSSESFEALVTRTEDLLDNLCVSLTDEELEVIEKLYRRAIKLEINFFATQPIVQPTVVPLSRKHDPAKHCFSVFSSFDLTCTAYDPTAIFAQYAKMCAPKSDLKLPERAQISESEMKKRWDIISAQHTQEYQQCVASVLPNEKAEEFVYESLCKALEPISDVQKQANIRAEELGVLKGIPKLGIKLAGLYLPLQDGCVGFFQAIQYNEKLNADVYIISYSWSVDLIKSALSSGGIRDLEVHANDLAYHDFSFTSGEVMQITTGEIVKRVESPVDKIRIFKQISEKQSVKGGDHLSVFIGDSVGDLRCLLEADVGIVFGFDESLRTLASQFGVRFVSLFYGLIEKQKEVNETGSPSSNWKGSSTTLYTVSSWAEIHAFVLGAP